MSPLTSLNVEVGLEVVQLHPAVDLKSAWVKMLGLSRRAHSAVRNQPCDLPALIAIVRAADCKRVAVALPQE